MAERPATVDRTATVTRPAPVPGPCCPPAPTVDPGSTAQIVLVGNPNVGKSTLFNALTGSAQKVGNWPGKTVHVAEGTWRLRQSKVTLVDLPGTYSLIPASPDEELTRDLLLAPIPPDLVVVIADAANLGRNLYLVGQVLDVGVPVVVALSMTDLATSRGLDVDPVALSTELGVPVVAVQPRERKGLDDLRDAVAASLADPRPASPPSLGADVEAEISRLVGYLDAPPHALRWAALNQLTGTADDPATVAARDRLLGDADAPPDPDTNAAPDTDADTAPDADADAHTDTDTDLDIPIDVDTLLAERRYEWAHRVRATVSHRRHPARLTWSDRVDQVLTSRWTGLPAFLLVMWGVFVATTRLAAPLQGGLAAVLDGPIKRGTGAALDDVGLHGGILRGFVLDGLISGVGQVLTFVPLMVIMFVLLALLEDSGYLARAAFVVDRMMRLIGLPGRAFLPLIVGFGCNVPALAGTRILPDARHRMLTGLLIPYVTCTARLTVYVLLASAFFGSGAGTVVFSMYLLSIVLVVTVGLLLRRTLFRGMTHEALVLELPPYRRPTPRVVVTQTWQKLSGFLRTAGGIIVATVVVVWLLSSVAVSGQSGVRVGTVPIADSVFGQVSRTISPAFSPAGFGDWHASSALITGFVAKEAVVATQAQTYSAAEPANLHQAGDLGTQLRATFERTSHHHPVPAVLAFMVFLLAYTPCMATVAAQRVEIGTKLTMIGMGMQIVVAWTLAVAVFQIGRLFV